MAAPRDVLTDLLSASQAEALESAGRATWRASIAALEAALSRAPALSGVSGALLMPEEIAGQFDARHLAAPLEISSNQDQSAIGYIVVGTREAAAFFGSQADDPTDEEQQTLVIASTVLGHVLEAINRDVLGDSVTQLTLSLDDLAANVGADLLSGMEDAAFVLKGSLGGEDALTVTLVLPGTFLEIAAAGLPEMSEVEQPPAPPVSKEPPDLPFTLTADELDAAALVDAPREAGGGGREPTPISRARFAPLPEPPQRETRAGMDLLAGLQMNVSVELGRTELTVADVLGLGPGSVIELNKLAGEPVDILVNDRLIARGEVVVVDENFGVRVVEVVRRGAEVEERVG